MNHRKPKTAKIILGVNLGLYHHVDCDDAGSFLSLTLFRGS